MSTIEQNSDGTLFTYRVEFNSFCKEIQKLEVIGKTEFNITYLVGVNKRPVREKYISVRYQHFGTLAEAIKANGSTRPVQGAG